MHRNCRPDLRSRKSCNRQPGDNSMEQYLSPVGKEDCSGNSMAVMLSSMSNQVRNAKHATKSQKKKKTGHRFMTKTCRIKKQELLNPCHITFSRQENKKNKHLSRDRCWFDRRVPRLQDTAPRRCRGCRRHQNHRCVLPDGLPRSQRVSRRSYPSCRSLHLPTGWR